MEKEKCERCMELSILEDHHDYRRRNNRNSIKRLCHKCHMWVHSNPKLAREEGFYKPLDNEYHKKQSSPKKWVLKKTINKL